MNFVCFCLVSWTALCWMVRKITFSLDEFDLSYGIKTEVNASRL